MRTLLFLAAAAAACLVQHSRLATWVVAPDLPLALAAWAVVVGDRRRWLLRFWLVGAIRDLIDPGSVWFHAGLHLALGLALLPALRWLPGPRALALALVGTILPVLAVAADALVSAAGLWSPWQLAGSALATAAAAVLSGLAAHPPRRTIPVEDLPKEAGGPPDDPGRAERADA